MDYYINDNSILKDNEIINFINIFGNLIYKEVCKKPYINEKNTILFA